MKALKLKATGEWVRFDDDLPEGYGTSLIPQLFPDTATLEDFRNSLQIDEFELVEVDIVTPTISKTEPKDIEDAAKEYLDKYFLGSIMSRREAIKLMSDFAAIRAVEFAEWLRRNRWKGRKNLDNWIRQTFVGVGKAYFTEVKTTAELYAKFSADAGGKEGE